MISVIMVFSSIQLNVYAAEEENTDYKYDSPKMSSYTIQKTDSKGKTRTVFTASGRRKATCSKMNSMSNVKWSVDKSFTYKYQGDSKLRIRKGMTYYGVPYTQKNREHYSSSRSLVQKRITKASLKEDVVKGLDCSSAVAYAIRDGKKRKDSSTYLMGSRGSYVSYEFLYDGMRDSAGTAVTISGKKISYQDNLHYVGWYGNYTGYSTARTSKSIVNKLRTAYPKRAGNIYSNVYAKVHPGDALVKAVKKEDGAEGHVMLVTGVRLVYKEDGTIDPVRSRFVVTDQNQPDIRYVKSKKWASSWRRNYCGPNSNFALLRSLGYLPVSAFNGKDSFTLKYDTNGGRGTFKDQKKKLYEPIKIRTKVPKLKGHTFTGWKPKRNVIKRIYKPGDYYNEDNNETLKAQWEKNKLIIKYNVGKGENAPKKQIKTYGKSITLSKRIPKREGYTFKGWALEKGGKVKYRPGATYSSDRLIRYETNVKLTLYAVWEKKA